MYTISLLPSEYKVYQNAQKRNDLIITIGIIIISCLITAVILSSVIASSYNRELTMIKDNNHNLVEQIDKLKPIELLQNQADALQLQINQAAGVSPEWNKLVISIGNSVPATVGLISLSAIYNETDQTGIIIITGNATNHDAVALWLSELGEIEGMGEVLCQFSTKVDPDVTKSVGFEINISPITVTTYNLNMGGVQ